MSLVTCTVRSVWIHIFHMYWSANMWTYTRTMHHDLTMIHRTLRASSPVSAAATCIPTHHLHVASYSSIIVRWLCGLLTDLDWVHYIHSWAYCNLPQTVHDWPAVDTWSLHLSTKQNMLRPRSRCIKHHCIICHMAEGSYVQRLDSKYSHLLITTLVPRVLCVAGLPEACTAMTCWYLEFLWTTTTSFMDCR